MGPAPHRGLRGGLAVLLAGLALVVALVWAAPELARRVVETRRGGVATRAADPAAVDAFVARALPAAGEVRRLEQQEREGVVRSTWQLAPGLSAQQLAETIRGDARAAGIELHASPRDQLDAQLRVYAGSHLRHEILLIPSLPAATPPPRPVNRRERPLVSLVVGGLGEQEARTLVRTEAPLTIAIRPYTPYALATARDAAMAWQEILVELEDGHGDANDALAAVPLATGALIRDAGGERMLGDAALDGVVSLRRSSEALPEGLWVVRPWQVRQRALADLLARIRHLAVSEGQVSVFMEHDDPATAGLLQWAAEGHDLGYRLVHASELARAEDTLGLLDRDNPKAKVQ